MLKLPTGSNITKAVETPAVKPVVETPTKLIYRPPGRVIKTNRRKLTHPDELSVREKEVLALLIQGIKPATIAKMLKIREKTVKFHKTRIYKKLKVNGIAQLLAKQLNKTI